MKDVQAEVGSLTIYRRLLRYSARYWPIAIFALVGMILEAAAAGAFTWLMKPLIDGTFIERDPQIIFWLPFAIVLIFVVRGIAVFMADTGMAKIGRSVVHQMRTDVFAAYLRLPSAHFDTEGTASALAKITYNAEQVYQASSDAVKTVVTDSLTIIVLISVMLSNSVRLTLATLITGPLIALIVWRVGKRYRRISGRVQNSVAEATQIADQALSGQEVVKIFGGRAHEESRFAKVSLQNVRQQVKMTATSATSTAVVQVLAASGLAVIVYLATQFSESDQITAGAFMSLMTAMMAMLPSLKKITTVQANVQRGVVAAQGLFEILDAPSEQDHGKIELGRAKGSLEFRNISVRYNESHLPALQDINLVCAAGTVTALVGRSGSGKSSLVRLLPRLYEPASGAVVLDGEDVTSYALASLRKQIAVVTQNVILFDDTIAANIAYGDLAGASLADIEAAAEAANAMEFIRRMPQGLQSPVGGNGALLSGGQKQRIAIARAILKDAPILILDEATSALDSESERLIQDALARIMKNRTTLVIAHRLSTVERADQIVVLDQGRIVESGNHEALLAQQGRYAALHRMQFRDSDN